MIPLLIAMVFPQIDSIRVSDIYYGRSEGAVYVDEGEVSLDLHDAWFGAGPPTLGAVNQLNWDEYRANNRTIPVIDTLTATGISYEITGWYYTESTVIFNHSQIVVRETSDRYPFSGTAVGGVVEFSVGYEDNISVYFRDHEGVFYGDNPEVFGSFGPFEFRHNVGELELQMIDARVPEPAYFLFILVALAGRRLR